MRDRDCVRGVDAVCHQAAMVGLGVDFADVTDYVAENDLGTAVLLRALHDRRMVRAARAREQHGRVRRRTGSLRRTTASVRPRRATRALSTPASSSRRARNAGDRSNRVSVPEDAHARPAQRLRRDQAPPGAPLQRLRPRARRRHGHRAALPQRLRAADAAEHAVRRGREHLPQRARTRGRAPRSSKTAASSATSSTCATSPAPTCSRSRATSRTPERSTSRAADPAHGARDGRGARPRVRVRRSRSEGDRSVARRRRPPRLRRASTEPHAAPRLPRRDQFRRRHARIRDRRAAAVADRDQRAS